MLGYIGGIYGLLYSFGHVIFNMLTQRIFYSSVISTLYHLEKNFTPNVNFINKSEEPNLKNRNEDVREKQRVNKDESKN